MEGVDHSTYLKEGDKTDCNNYKPYHYCQLCIKFCPTSCYRG